MQAEIDLDKREIDHVKIDHVKKVTGRLKMNVGPTENVKIHGSPILRPE